MHPPQNTSSPSMFRDSSRSPSLGFNEPLAASRSQSVAPMNRVPPLDYARGYSGIPQASHIPHQSLGMPYNNAAMQNDISLVQSLQSTLHLVLEEVEKMNHRISSIEATNQTILSNQQLLTNRVNATEEAVNRIEDALLALSFVSEIY